jgi:hypothetical protein
MRLQRDFFRFRASAKNKNPDWSLRICVLDRPPGDPHRWGHRLDRDAVRKMGVSQ